ncbi:MAG: hypothetical protein VX470_04600, partial [Planctomycetota bacterium]|nr:hypothetical protein [Planctomycetota bacterium]
MDDLQCKWTDNSYRVVRLTTLSWKSAKQGRFQLDYHLHQIGKENRIVALLAPGTDPNRYTSEARFTDISSYL